MTSPLPTEFFERQKSQARSNKKPKDFNSSKGGSLDLLSLFMTQKTNSSSKSNKSTDDVPRQPIKVDLERITPVKGRGRRQWHVEMGPISPCRTSSQFEAHIHMCNKLLKESEGAEYPVSSKEHNTDPSQAASNPPQAASHPPQAASEFSLSDQIKATSAIADTTKDYMAHKIIATSAEMYANASDFSSHKSVAKTPCQRDETFIPYSKPPGTVSFSSKITFLQTPSPDNEVLKTMGSHKETALANAPARFGRNTVKSPDNFPKVPIWQEDTPILMGKRSPDFNGKGKDQRPLNMYMGPVNDYSSLPSMPEERNTIPSKRGVKKQSLDTLLREDFLERKRVRKSESWNDYDGSFFRRGNWVAEDFQETPLQKYDRRALEKQRQRHNRHKSNSHKQSREYDCNIRKAKKDVVLACDDDIYNRMHCSKGVGKLKTPAYIGLLATVTSNPKPSRESHQTWNTFKEDGKPTNDWNENVKYDRSVGGNYSPQMMPSKLDEFINKQSCPSVLDDKRYNSKHTNLKWGYFTRPSPEKERIDHWSTNSKVDQSSIDDAQQCLVSEADTKEPSETMSNPSYCDDAVFNQVNARTGWENTFTPMPNNFSTPMCSNKRFISENPLSVLHSVSRETNEPQDFWKPHHSMSTNTNKTTHDNSKTIDQRTDRKRTLDIGFSGIEKNTSTFRRTHFETPKQTKRDWDLETPLITPKQVWHESLTETPSIIGLSGNRALDKNAVRVNTGFGKTSVAHPNVSYDESEFQKTPLFKWMMQTPSRPKIQSPLKATPSYSLPQRTWTPCRENNFSYQDKENSFPGNISFMMMTPQLNNKKTSPIFVQDKKGSSPCHGNPASATTTKFRTDDQSTIASSRMPGPEIRSNHAASTSGHIKTIVTSIMIPCFGSVSSSATLPTPSQVDVGNLSSPTANQGGVNNKAAIPTPSQVDAGNTSSPKLSQCGVTATLPTPSQVDKKNPLSSKPTQSCVSNTAATPTPSQVDVGNLSSPTANQGGVSNTATLPTPSQVDTGNASLSKLSHGSVSSISTLPTPSQDAGNSSTATPIQVGVSSRAVLPAPSQVDAGNTSSSTPGQNGVIATLPTLSQVDTGSTSSSKPSQDGVTATVPTQSQVDKGNISSFKPNQSGNTPNIPTPCQVDTGIASSSTACQVNMDEAASLPSAQQTAIDLQTSCQLNTENTTNSSYLTKLI